MLPDPSMTRRRALKTLFCSSVAMKLNLSSVAMAEETTGAPSLDFLAVGDFGSGDEKQKAVGRAMARYVEGMGKSPDGLLMLGDNFYGSMRGGLKSERWQTGFSNIYPSKNFPNPCWAVLGNHDYHDEPGNEKVQLGYAASRDHKTRWTMPGKYYRVDRPQVTLLMIDTNWESINRRVHGDKTPCWMTAQEQADQQAWLEKQLASPRAPFTVVLGHHPLYSDSAHKDTPELVEGLGPLFEKSGVHLYLGGHDHDLQHLELDGLKTSFVISGGGGARVYGHEKVRKNTFIQDVYGFSHLSFRNQRLLLRHVDANGKMVHAFSKGVNHDWKVEA
ncbi:MAG: metallophosphoesterase [Verrucomicrobiota bacterium]